MSHTVFTEIEQDALMKKPKILGTSIYENYDIPPLISQNGELAPWEPEQNAVFYSCKPLHGIAQTFNSNANTTPIRGYRDFTYMTMAHQPVEVAYNDGTIQVYINRSRNDFNYRNAKWINKDGTPEALRNADDFSVAFKTAGKIAETLQEWEVSVKSLHPRHVRQAFEEKYPNMPDQLKQALLGEYNKVIGSMLVKRAGFNSLNTVQDGIHTHIVDFASSVDIGRILVANLALTGPENSPVLSMHNEFETEATGISSTAKGLTEQDLREIIIAGMDDVWRPMSTYCLEQQIPEKMSKTEHIIKAVETNLTPAEIEMYSVKAHEYKDGKRLGAAKSLTKEINQQFSEMPDIGTIHLYAEGKSTSMRLPNPTQYIPQPARVISFH